MTKTHNYVVHANNVLERLHAKACNTNLADFGCDMLHHHSFSVATAAATVQRDRIKSKFFKPSASGETILREQCFKDWIAYEDVLRSKRLYTRLPNGDRDVYRLDWWGNLSSESRSILLKARNVLHKHFGQFSIDLHNADVDFTPGETDMSSGGRVSVLQKLKNKDNWRVTAEAFEDFCRLTYHNASLKRAAKAHFKPMTAKELANLNFENDNSGYACFRARFKEMVTITYGSVGDSVFKNLIKRRFINKEPLGNMLLQRLPAAGMRTTIDKNFANNLEVGQERHRIMIKDFTKATIDFSNASDSIHMDLVWFLFPASLRKYLFKWRSDFVLIDDVWYMPEKLCSMGNGFCFETLTLVLLAISRVLDANSSVYGDDVIIDNKVANVFVEVMSAVGFTVNKKKSFINSSFRESCGAFYMDGIGYLSTYDIKWVETTPDFVVTCNKIFRIYNGLPDGEHREMYEQAWHELSRLCPPLLKGPVMDGPALEEWVFDHKYDRAKRACKDTRALRTKLIEKCFLALLAYQVDLDKLYIATKHKFTSNTLTPTRQYVRCPFQLGHYLFSNRMAEDRIRGNPRGKTARERRGMWTECNFFVLPTGHNFTVKDAIAYHNQILVAVACLLHVHLINARKTINVS